MKRKQKEKLLMLITTFQLQVYINNYLIINLIIIKTKIIIIQIYCISHRRSLVRFSSRKSAEGKRKFSQVNDPVACFWVIFGSRPEVLELARSLNSYFLECYIWSC